MKITLIVPIYNEIKGIDLSISRLENFLKERKNFDCIIVNDGSTDGTENYLNKINSDRIRVVHKENGGYGSAIKFGSKFIKTDYFGIIDADGTYPIEEFDKMSENLELYDMVVGSRTGKNVSIPFIKKIPKFFIKVFSNYISDKKIPDFNSGMRLFKTSLFRKFIFFIPNGFSLTTTLSVILSSLDYKIKFYQINYFDRLGKSKIKPFKDTINFFLTIAKIGIFFKPFRVYGPLIIFFFLIGFALLIYRFLYGEGLLVVTLLSFLISLFLLIFCLISTSISQLILLKIYKTDEQTLK